MKLFGAIPIPPLETYLLSLPPQALGISPTILDFYLGSNIVEYASHSSSTGS